MAYLNIQYDPAWAAFQKSYKAAHPLVETDAEKADQAKLDAFLQNMYDPNSPTYRQGVGSAAQAFPGVQQWIQQNIDYDKAISEAFQKQYGHSPILGSTIGGPLQKTTSEATASPVTPPATVSPTTTATPSAVTPPNLTNNLLVTPPAATAGQNALTALQMLLGRGATGGLGTYKFPDLVKQTQQRWGGFSPAAFSKP